MEKGEPKAKKTKAAKQAIKKPTSDIKCKDGKCDRSTLDPRIILTTMVCVLVAVLIILVLFYAGLCAGGKRSIFETNEDISVISVDYNVPISSKKIPGADNGMIIEALDVKKKGENYAVIESNDQFNQLLGLISERNGEVIENFIPSSFFNSSSVIVVESSAKEIISPVVNSISRDGDYNLTISLSGSAAPEDSDKAKPATYLSILTVANINPDQVSVLKDNR